MKKPFKIISLICYILFFIIESYAQNKVVIPPSPEAASLGKYAEAIEGIYTGIPSVQIPIYSYKSGTLSLPVSLSYYSGGIKVEEEASWVGLGWSLIAGGTISRSIKGKDDLGLGGYPFSPAPNSSDGNYMTSVSSGVNDSEPDIFYFSLPGKSGKFILEQGAGYYKGLSFSQDRIKITYETSTQAWELTSEDGTKYVYSSKEYVTPEQSSGPSYSSALSSFVSSSSSVSAWNLSKIIGIDGTEINFEYTSAPIYYRTTTSVNQTFRVNYSAAGLPQCLESSISPGITYSGSRNTYGGIYLKRISGPNGYIEFNTEGRFDLEPTGADLPQRLKEIKVYGLTGELLKTFSLTHEYYNGQQSDYSQKRLKLKSIVEKNGSLELKPYTFDYYKSSGYAFDLPAKNSASRDWWGFFNGKDNANVWSTYFNTSVTNSLVPPIQIVAGDKNIYDTGANRSPDEEASKIGILSRVTYPTGGETIFNYEGNKYYEPWSDGGIVHKDETIYKYGPTITNPPQNITDQIIVDLTSASSATLVSIVATVYCYNFLEFGTACYNRSSFAGEILLLKPDNSLEAYRSISTNNASADYSVTDVTPVNVYLPPGKYIIRARVQNDAWVSQLNIQYDSPGSQGTVHLNKLAGGVRLLKRTERPLIGSDKISNFKYDEDNGASSGVIMIPYQQYHSYENLNVFCDVNQQGTIHYLTRKSWSNYPLGSGASGNHIGYGRVLVYSGDNGEFGKTEYRYMNDPEVVDYAIRIPDETTFIPNSNGLLLSKTSYIYTGNNQFQEVEKIENTYLDNSDLTKPIRGIKLYTIAINGQVLPSMYKSYTLFSERWNLLTNKITKTELGGAKSVTETNYTYGNTAHLQLTKTRVSQSDYGTLETTFKYPLDYNNVGNRDAALTTMINRNMVTPVIEKKTIMDRNSQRNVVGAELTTYKVVNGNVPVPNITYGFNSASPVAEGSFPAYGGTSSDMNHSMYRERLRYNTYDSRSNVLEVTSNGGDKTSYVWGYNGQYPIAEIRNAGASDVDVALGADGRNRGSLDTQFDEGTLKGWLQSLQGRLGSALVKGYTYKPGVGISSIIDPSGRAAHYLYDGVGRLKEIRDNGTSEPLIQSFDYNYADQGAYTNVNTNPGVTAPNNPGLTGNPGCNVSAPTINPSSATYTPGGAGVTLTGSCSGTIKWSTGATTTSITVTPAATTQYYAVCQQGSCESSQTYATVNVGGSSVLADGCYIIKSKITNNALEAVTGDFVEQRSANGSQQQVWKVESIGNNQYKITVQDGSGKAVGVGNEGFEARVSLGSYTGSSLQKWTLQSDGNGAYRVFTPGGFTWDMRESGASPILQLYGTTSDGFQNQRLFFFQSTACSGGTGTTSQCLEAEASSNKTGDTFENSGASGGNVMRGYANPSEYVEYAVNVPAGGTYTLKLWYVSPETPTGGVIINGGSVQAFPLPTTGSNWLTLGTATKTITLQAGSNTIRIQGGSGGSFHQDKICVEGGGSTGCTAPAAPSNVSANPASITSGGSSSLSASGCSGTVTWYSGGSAIGTENPKTVSPGTTTTYTATCKVGTCESAPTGVVVTVTPPAGTSLCMEAESSPNKTGGTFTNANASNGTVMMNYSNSSEYVEYTFNVPADGTYTLKLWYVSPETPTAGLIVNSGSLETFPLPTTGSNWLTLGTATKSVTLHAGSNTIRIQGGSGGGFHQDKACVESGGSTGCTTPAAPNSLTATPASISSGGSSSLSASGCSGTVTWYSGGSAIGTGNPKSVNPGSTTTYTATCTVGSCVSASSSGVTVTVVTNGNPNANGLTQALVVVVNDISGQPSTKKRITITNPVNGSRSYRWSVYRGDDDFRGMGEHYVSSNGVFDVDLSSFNLLVGTEYRFWVADEADGFPAPHQGYGTFTVTTGSSCNFTLTPAADQIAKTGSTVTLTTVCSGSDCDALTYSWSGQGISSSPNNKTVSFTAPSSVAPFTYTVQVTKSGCTAQTLTTVVTTMGTGPITVGNCYQIQGFQSLKYLQTGGSGVPVKQYTAANSANQVWKVEDAGSGQVRMLSVNGYVWDVSGSGTADGTILKMNDWYGTNNQKFIISVINDSSGGYRITPVHAQGSCIEMPGFSVIDGTGAVLSTWSPDTGNRRWNFVPKQCFVQ